MSTQVNTKVRLVRCPKCRKLLPELPDLPLYQCGGCNTILQAKIRKTETSHSETASQPKDSAAKFQHDFVSNEKAVRSPNHDLASSSNGESSSVKEKIDDRDEHKGSSAELSMDRRVTDGVSTSPEANCLENEGSTPLQVEDHSSESSPVQNSRIFRDRVRSSSGVIMGAEDFLEGFSTSGELSYHEDVEKEEEGHFQCYDNQNENKGGDIWKMVKEDHSSQKKEDKETYLPLVGAEHEKDVNRACGAEQNDWKSEDRLGNENGGLCGNIMRGDDESSADDVVSPKTRNASQLAEPCISDSSFKRPSTIKSSNAGVGDSCGALTIPVNGAVSSVSRMSPDDEHLNHPVKKAIQIFETVNSVDPISERRIRHRDMTGSPATRKYKACGASDSSYDGNDDRMSEQISCLPQRNREDGLNHMLNKETEVSNRAPSSSSVPQGNQFIAKKGRSLNQAEFTETKSTGHINGNRKRLDEQGVASRLPFAPRDLRTESRPGSSSISHQNVRPPRSGVSLTNKHSYLEPDEKELLRMVRKLKDQLERMHFSLNPRYPVGVVEEEYAPYYQGHFATERGMCGSMTRPGCHPRPNSTTGRTQQATVSRLAFSGEAPHFRHQINCSCLHCCRKDRCHSAQLPSQFTYHEDIPNTCHGCCGISSPQHYMSSEVSLHRREVNWKNTENEIKKLYLRERYCTGKKLLRPIAGGAPVVVCHHCTELLQIPSDFLLFKKRYHQLRCSSCRKIMKFSLLERTRIVPHLLDASAPLRTEADNNIVRIDQRNLGLSSTSNSSQQVESLLHSDEYGQSFDTTEGEASSIVLPSYDFVHRNAYNRKMSSYGQILEVKKLKSILKESRDKVPVKMFDSAGPSSRVPNFKKVPSAIEEQSTISPLER